MLDRRQILRSGSPAPAVTPFVRIPPNGGEISQWVAKQVLDQGVYEIVWPHVSTIEKHATRLPRADTHARVPPPISSPPDSAVMHQPPRHGIGGSASRSIMHAPTFGRSIRRARS